MNITGQGLLQNFAHYLKKNNLVNLVEKEANLVSQSDQSSIMFSKLSVKEVFNKKSIFFEQLLTVIENSQNIKIIYKELFEEILTQNNSQINSFDLICLSHLHQKLLLSYLPSFSSDPNINNSITQDILNEYLEVQKLSFEMFNRKIAGSELISEFEKREQKNEVYKELKLQTQRLSDLILNIPGIVWEFMGVPDENQKLTYVCNYASEMTGFTLDKWLNTPYFWLKIIHPDDRKTAKDEIRKRFICPNSSDSIQYRIINNDNKIMWVETYITSICDKDNKSVGIRGITFDINRWKEAEEALIENKEKLSLIFNSSSDLMLLVSVEPDGNFKTVSANTAYMKTIRSYNPDITDETFFGASLEEICRDLFGFNQFVIDSLYNKYNEAIKKGQPISYEESINFEAIKFYAEITLTPIFDRENISSHLLYVSRNITERKLAEIEIERQRLELKRSNEALEQFALVASHDLQEPLRMVKKYVQLLAKRYKGKFDSDADDFIYYATDGASRMETLIKNLFDYARLERSETYMDLTDINYSVEVALMNLKHLTDENQAIITHDVMPTLKVDSIQITQLFQNLIANAIKYRKEEFPLIHISSEKKEKEWLFSVKDNGIGISPDNFDKVFQLFKRLDNSEERSGLGIGLAVCKKIVERHGGSIWVNSEEGRNSTFFFTIPEN